MKKELCRLLDHGIWVSAHRNPALWKVSPCCIVKYRIPMESSNWQQKLQSFRDANTCNDCIDHSGLGDKLDTRAMSFRLPLPANTASDEVLYANITLGTDCNAACMSCGPHLSSTWEKQVIKLNNQSAVNATYNPLTDEEIVNRLFEVIDFNKLVNLNISGGEPFYTAGTEILLNRIVNECNPSAIALSVYTNCSLPVPLGIVKLLGSFKSVRLVLSIDDIGSRFEYLRYPLSWDRALSAITSYKAIPEISEFRINMATGVLNVWYYDQLEAWANEFFSSDPRFTGIMTSHGIGEVGLGMTTLPFSVALLDKYQNNTVLKTLVSRFSGKSNLAQFLEYTEKMDKFRQQSWRETFPDIVKYVDL